MLGGATARGRIPTSLIEHEVAAAEAVWFSAKDRNRPNGDVRQSLGKKGRFNTLCMTACEINADLCHCVLRADDSRVDH